MKVIINTKLLTEKIQLASNTLDTSGLNPILAGILFNVGNNSITLISSNNNCYSQINIDKDLKIESEGKFLVKGKMILDILSNLKSNKVTLEIIDESVLRIYNDTFSCNLNILDINSYPTISFYYTDWLKFTLSNSFVKKINNKLSNFVATTIGSNNVLTGICIDSNNENNLIKAVATDSFHLAFYQEDYNGPKFKFVIDTKILNFLNNLIENNKGNEIFFWFNSGKLIIECNRNLFFFKLSENEYPSVYKTLESNYTNSFEVNKSQLNDALNRALPLIQNDKNSTVRIAISNDKISISTKSIEFGDTFEEVEITNTNISGEFEFLLNIRFLNHILKVFDDQVVTFNFTGNNRPILITDKKDNNLKFLVLPLRN